MNENIAPIKLKLKADKISNLKNIGSIEGGNDTYASGAFIWPANRAINVVIIIP